MGETHRGAAGFRDWLTVWNEASESWNMDIEEVTAIDSDRVVLVWAGTIRGKQSHAVVSQRGAAVMTVQDGKVTRTEMYPSPEQALQAARLTE
jgi:ketosteroid isomerase-like protein